MASQLSEHPYAALSRLILKEYCDKEEMMLKIALDVDVLPSLSDDVAKTEPYSESTLPHDPVCIIGAGMAGLYTALIFDSLRIPYEILEASDRCGGRMFTHKFKNGSEYDYYDAGAMRFPDTPFMKRTFDLFKKFQDEVKLIPYILAAPSADEDHTLLYFNGVRVPTRSAPQDPDPFHVAPHIAPQFLDASLRYILDSSGPLETGILARPRSLFRTNDIPTATRKLIEDYGTHTMRSYVQQEFKGITPADINYMEMLSRSTGTYDRALTEAVFGSLAFGWPGNKSLPWYCIDKGSSTLPKAMEARIKHQIKYLTPVLGIAQHCSGMSVQFSEPIKHEIVSQVYSAVISTVPLPCLRAMDLSECGLAGENYPQWSALRQGQYDPSIKIGLRFTEPWWETATAGLKIVGGQSYTDLPIRTIVYPSYPHSEDDETLKSSTLIVSYPLTEDAQRIGAWINKDGTADPRLIPMVLNQLRNVHDFDPAPYYTGDYFAWNWTTNPYSMGAFAHFGPQEFSGVYPHLIEPAANNKLFFAGEATSTCHGWVAGALDSAWRAVNQYLSFHYPKKSVVSVKFEELWGKSEYWENPTPKNGEPEGPSLFDRYMNLAPLKESILRRPAVPV